MERALEYTNSIYKALAVHFFGSMRGFSALRAGSSLQSLVNDWHVHTPLYIQSFAQMAANNDPSGMHRVHGPPS